MFWVHDGTVTMCRAQQYLVADCSIVEHQPQQTIGLQQWTLRLTDIELIGEWWSQTSSGRHIRQTAQIRSQVMRSRTILLPCQRLSTCSSCSTRCVNGDRHRETNKQISSSLKAPFRLRREEPLRREGFTVCNCGCSCLISRRLALTIVQSLTESYYMTCRGRYWLVASWNVVELWPESSPRNGRDISECSSLTPVWPWPWLCDLLTSWLWPSHLGMFLNDLYDNVPGLGILRFIALQQTFESVPNKII